MAQVEVSRDLRVHIQVKNDLCGTSKDKVTLLEGLEHGTHQQGSEKVMGLRGWAMKPTSM